MFSILLGIELRVELLRPMLTLYLTSGATARLFFRVAAPFHSLGGLLGWAPGKLPRGPAPPTLPTWKVT